MPRAAASCLPGHSLFASTPVRSSRMSAHLSLTAGLETSPEPRIAWDSTTHSPRARSGPARGGHCHRSRPRSPARLAARPGGRGLRHRGEAEEGLPPHRGRRQRWARLPGCRRRRGCRRRGWYGTPGVQQRWRGGHWHLSLGVPRETASASSFPSGLPGVFPEGLPGDVPKRSPGRQTGRPASGLTEGRELSGSERIRRR